MEINKENKIYPKVETPFGWGRNLNYIKAKFEILFKELFEFKANIYAGLINNIFSVLVQAILLFVFYSNFNEIIGWKLEEYLFFMIMTNFILRIIGIFVFVIDLNRKLLSGAINSLLTKPINIFIQYFLSSIAMVPLFLSFLYFILFLIYLYLFFDVINFFKLFLLIPFILLSILFNILLLRFIDALAFFVKNNSFLINTYWDTQRIFHSNPITLFPKNTWKYFNLFGVIYYGSYATLFLFGDLSYNLFILLNIILILLIIIFGVGIYLLWYYGLKKYEAFG